MQDFLQDEPVRARSRPRARAARLSSCGAGEARRSDLLVAAQELDEEALEPGEDEVEREQHAGPEAVAPAPQQPGEQARRERLVDRRRVDLHPGRRRHGPVRVAHRPRQVAHLAVVPVAGDLAADPPDPVAEHERHGRRGRGAEAQEVPPPGPDDARRWRRR